MKFQSVGEMHGFRRPWIKHASMAYLILELNIHGECKKNLHKDSKLNNVVQKRNIIQINIV